MNSSGRVERARIAGHGQCRRERASGQGDEGLQYKCTYRLRSPGAGREHALLVPRLICLQVFVEEIEEAGCYASRSRDAANGR